MRFKGNVEGKDEFTFLPNSKFNLGFGVSALLQYMNFK